MMRPWEGYGYCIMASPLAFSTLHYWGQAMAQSRTAERRFYLAFVILIFGAVLLDSAAVSSCGCGSGLCGAACPQGAVLPAARHNRRCLVCRPDHAVVAHHFGARGFASTARHPFDGPRGRRGHIRHRGIRDRRTAPDGFVDVSSPPEVFLAIPLLGLLQYAVFVVPAYLKRSNAQTHKRLMLLASLSILSAAIIRWPVAMIYAPSPLPGFGYYDLVALAYLLPLVAWDLTTLKRIHPVTLYGGLVLIAMVPIIGRYRSPPHGSPSRIGSLAPEPKREGRGRTAQREDCHSCLSGF